MGRQRVASIDIVRGAVMVLMAIDHVRVYSGVPAGGPTFGIFFTRWVTHFCAPAFVFLAGTAAYLHGRALHDRGALARYLVTRGLILIVLELTLIRLSWTFSLDYADFILAGVIWMLGWCMILLDGLIWLPTWAIGTLGIVVMAGQDFFGQLPRVLPPALVPAYGFVYPAGESAPFRIGASGPEVTILYTIVPWVGVIAAGYALGAVVMRNAAERRRRLLWLGLTATVLFIVFSGVATSLEQASPDAPPVLIRFLNTRKYPASQLFLLMTLGPTILALAFAERARGAVARVLETFGRVPMFYYLLHIPLIHTIALVVWLLRDGSAGAGRFATAPYVSIPPPERWSLGLLYAVFVVVVALLYFPCRWFAELKARKEHAVLRYL
jgi:uncharacterized membrane protein